MSEDSDQPIDQQLEPLPAEKLCNAWGEGNPILGNGPLCNEEARHIYYQGNDKKKLVVTLQKMLRTLGYDLGTSGPDNDGVDGDFGDKTEENVIDFQSKSKDWDGEQLNEEGLVGPRTSDALNRAMVGKWYDHYQTQEKLVEGKPYHTVTPDFLANGLLIIPGKAKEGKVFLVGKIGETYEEDPITILLLDSFARPISCAPYKMNIEGRIKTGQANEDGLLFLKNEKKPSMISLDWGFPPDQESRDQNPNYSFHLDLSVGPQDQNEDEKAGAGRRLRNLGYYTSKTLEGNIRSFQRAYGLPQTGLLEDIKDRLWRYHDNGPPDPLPTSGEPDLDANEDIGNVDE